MKTTWKWHNFLCCFSLWLGALSLAFMGVRLLSNGARTALVILLGLLLTGGAVLYVVMTVDLIMKKSAGVTLLKVMYGISIAISAITVIIAFSWYNLFSLGVSVGIYAANNTYYNNRAEYFSAAGTPPSRRSMKILCGVLLLTAAALLTAYYVMIGIYNIKSVMYRVTYSVEPLGLLLVGLAVLTEKRPLKIAGAAACCAYWVYALVEILTAMASGKMYTDYIIRAVVEAGSVLAWAMALVMILTKKTNTVMKVTAAAGIIIGEYTDISSGVSWLSYRGNSLVLLLLLFGVVKIAAFCIFVFGLDAGQRKEEAPKMLGDDMENMTPGV